MNNYSTPQSPIEEGKNIIILLLYKTRLRNINATFSLDFPFWLIYYN